MGHNGSTYDYVIPAALIARSHVANYQLPTSSGERVNLRSIYASVRSYGEFPCVQFYDVTSWNYVN